MMAASGTQWSCPTRMAVVLGVDMASRQKGLLQFPVNTGANMPELVSVRVNEAMARRQVT